MGYAAIRSVSKWPLTVLRQGPDRDSNALSQCLWGDWVGVHRLKHEGGWLYVHTRGRDGWLPENQLMAERPLEVNFVDIGQGDGTFIVTPDDRKIVVDAGQDDNMYQFLRWRFSPKKKGNAKKGDDLAPAVEFDAAIITHSDVDHYLGFEELFGYDKFSFKTVFHNGIVERKSNSKAKLDALGPSFIHNDQRYLKEVIRNKAELEQLLRQEDKRGDKRYPNMLWDALNSPRVTDIRMLAAGDEVFERKKLFGKWLSMTALAPVPEQIDGRQVLRCFVGDPGKTTKGDAGKTKNGHSVVTVLQYGKVRILLGGDLNVPAECYLMQYYRDRGQECVFRADVGKSCHHGSSDFSTEFLEWINPMATVICSGDDENYCHPAPDSLGTVGKFSRGERSLILSTELARSAPERIKHPEEIRKKIMGQAIKMVDVYRKAKNKPEEELEKKFLKAQDRLQKTLDKKIQRSVEQYGMITLRTDGEKVLLAQRLEKTARRQKEAVKPRKLSKKAPKNWHVDCLEPEYGVLTFHSIPGKPQGRRYRCP